MLVVVIALISFDDDQMVMDECDVNLVWSDSSMGSLARMAVGGGGGGGGNSIGIAT